MQRMQFREDCSVVYLIIYERAQLTARRRASTTRNFRQCGAAHLDKKSNYWKTGKRRIANQPNTRWMLIVAMVACAGTA
jgi:hypothetical protein